MAQAKPMGVLGRREITRWTTRTIDRSSDRFRVHTFLRSTGYGLIAVTCYLSNDVSEAAQTLVEMSTGGYNYWRWYEHGVVTEIGAARLVNRFLADIREEWGDVQP